MLTKYTDADVKSELQREIELRLAQGEAVHPAWITHKVCRAHKDGLACDGEVEKVEPVDVAFWRFGAYSHTRKLATVCINELDEVPAQADPEPPFMPGFEHLQRQYVIWREGEAVMVPTESVTPAELRAKAQEHRRKATTSFAHADELDRYADIREHAMQPA